MGHHVSLTNARFTRDPEIVESQTGMKIANFSLATDEWDYQAKAKGAEFWDCKAFDKTAETIEAYCEKGRAVNVQGKLRTEKWIDKKTSENRSKKVLVIDPHGLELGPKPRGADDDDLSDVPGFEAKPVTPNLFG